RPSACRRTSPAAASASPSARTTRRSRSSTCWTCCPASSRVFARCLRRGRSERRADVDRDSTLTHLTDRFTAEQLAALTKRLESGEITDPMEIASVISDLGDVQYLHAKPVIEGYLNHPEAWV